MSSIGTRAFVEALLQTSEVESITLVELSSALINNLTKMPLFDEMLSDNRVQLIIDDGRRFLLQTDKKFDLILIDPLRTTTAYSNNLYSRQFFELVRRHLSDRGVFLVWMDERKVMPRTIATVFDHVKMYSMLKYLAFCLASNAPLQIDKEREQTIISHFSAADRNAVVSWESKFLKLSGDRDFIMRKTKGYPINEDWKPNCEYYLGRLKRDEELRKQVREMVDGIFPLIEEALE